MTDEIFSDDANGNDASYTTEDENVLNADGVYTYTHDAEGNRTEKFLRTDTSRDGEIDASEKTLVQTSAWNFFASCLRYCKLNLLQDSRLSPDACPSADQPHFLKKRFFRIFFFFLFANIYGYFALYFLLMSYNGAVSDVKQGMSHTFFYYAYTTQDVNFPSNDVATTKHREFYYYLFNPVDCLINPYREDIQND